MFRKFVDGEMYMMVVMHVDDILVRAKDQATMERFVAERGRKLKLKDTDGTEYSMRCHITRGAVRRAD